MKKTFILLFILSGSCLIADYIIDRQNAVKLEKARKYKEALSAYLKMSEGKVSDFQKSDALEQAVNCTLRLKHYDKANELLKQIPIETTKKFCRMNILAAQRKSADLIKAFGEEDLTKWPDYLSKLAYRTRGSAFHHAKNGQRAVDDFNNALKYPQDARTKAKLLIALGNTYYNLLKDTDKALVTYRRLYETSDPTRKCSGAIAVANILKNQKKFDQALQELKKMTPKAWPNTFTQGNMLITYGGIYATSGKKEEAIAKYKEVIDNEKIPRHIKDRAKRQLKSLTP